jgi:fructose-1,6-bisphosphatase II
MVSSDNVFVAATGVTDGELLGGVRYSADRAITHSLSMRSRSGAVRLIETRHRISTSNLVPQAP